MAKNSEKMKFKDFRKNVKDFCDEIEKLHGEVVNNNKIVTEEAIRNFSVQLQQYKEMGRKRVKHVRIGRWVAAAAVTVATSGALIGLTNQSSNLINTMYVGYLGSIALGLATAGTITGVMKSRRNKMRKLLSDAENLISELAAKQDLTLSSENVDTDNLILTTNKQEKEEDKKLKTYTINLKQTYKSDDGKRPGDTTEYVKVKAHSFEEFVETLNNSKTHTNNLYTKLYIDFEDAENGKRNPKVVLRVKAKNTPAVEREYESCDELVSTFANLDEANLLDMEVEAKQAEVEKAKAEKAEVVDEVEVVDMQ